MMRSRSHASTPRALVIGAGSIGKRHAQVLQRLDCSVRLVSRRPGAGHYVSIDEGIRSWAPDYVVLATETGDRLTSLAALRDTEQSFKLLIEKPLGSIPGDLIDQSQPTWVGYNLRFHPVILEVRSMLRSEDALSVQARAGQYLPDWRPDRDYRTTASNGIGGGVLRDLSHELDLLEWLVGPCHSLTAATGHLSGLDLTVEDVSATLMRYRRAPVVSLELNYLDRVAKRSMVITTNDHTIDADLIAGTIDVDGERVMQCSTGRDDTYAAMHRAILHEQGDNVCTLPEGQQVMRVIEAVENAAASRAWVDIA